MKRHLILIGLLGLSLATSVVAAEPLRPQNAFYQGGARMELVQSRNDYDRAIQMVLGRLGLRRENLRGVEKVSDEVYRVTVKDGPNVVTYLVNVRSGSMDVER
jgi:hypothetical protein